MSTAASLAAAKKRRGPQFQQPSQGANQSNKSNQLNQSNNKNQFETKVEMLTDRQILTKHEKRIFNIESLLKALLDERKNTINGNYVTKEDLSNLSLEKGGNENNENKQEIEKLKRTITALSKSNAEMNLKLAQIKSNLQDSNNIKKKVSIHEDLNQNKDNQDDENDDEDDDDDDDEHEDGEVEEKKEEIQLAIQ
tara:strand:- start:4243 stop:4827 length:585 start_codon:yes stop_codon:yes gene_type:complete